MLDVLIGAGLGCAVCAFGMWAFLHGVKAQIEARSGNVPEIPGLDLRERLGAPAQSRAAKKQDAELQSELVNALQGFNPSFKPEN